MDRLSSFAIYLIIGGMLLFPVVVITDNVDFILKPTAGTAFISILFLGLGVWFVFFINRSKRVYYKDSSLYIYNLFSRNFIIVNKDNCSVERFLFYDPNIWKITYYNENKDAKYVYFIRNLLCDDFNDIIDKLN